MWFKYLSTPSWRCCLQPHGWMDEWMDVFDIRFRYRDYFYGCIANMAWSKWIKVRCTIEMWVLHDRSTPTCKYGTNTSIANMIDDKII